MNPIALAGAATGGGLAVVRGAVGAATGFAGMLQKAVGGADGNEAEESAVDPARLRREIRAATERLQRRIRTLLAENGVPLTSNVRLAADDFGRLRLQSPHPQAALVESLLATKPDLAELFGRIADQKRELAERTGEGAHETFQLDVPPAGSVLNGDG